MIKIVENSPNLIHVHDTDGVDIKMLNACFIGTGRVEGFSFEMDKIQALFPDSELDRYKGRFEKAKESIFSRLILFDFLSKYCNINTKLLKIYYTDAGKPYFEDSHIHFSIAHSGKTALIAVSFSGIIGVDFEHESKKKDYKKLSKRFFHPEESNFLELSKEEELADLFLKMWIKKEAIVKCLGGTMFSMMSKINTLDNTIYNVDNQNIDLINFALINAENNFKNICLASVANLHQVFVFDCEKF